MNKGVGIVNNVRLFLDGFVYVRKGCRWLTIIETTER